MGRKKRPAAAPAATIDASTPAYPTPIVPTAFDPYGRPLPPPLPPQQESHAQPDGGGGVDGHASKRSRADDNTGGDAAGGGGDGGITEREVYPVKRYRPDTYYRSIESFARYTKSHRMLDASYVKWKGGGGTPEKPNVFGIRIAGTFLSWGRGKTRDAAIDAAIRAAFALVAAHGYDDFAFTDDCFTEEPLHNSGAMGLAPMPPPPPPPPPLPLGLPPGTVPPLPPGLPPGFPPGMSFPLPPGMPPHGLPPNFPLPPPPNNDLMIPQPAAPKAELAVASSVGDAGGNGVPSATAIGSASSGKPSILNISTNLGSSAPLIAPPAGSAEAAKKKSNNKLVFSGDDVDEHGEELSMEEVRMRTPRYWNLVVRAMNKRIRNDDDLVSSS